MPSGADQVAETTILALWRYASTVTGIVETSL